MAVLVCWVGTETVTEAVLLGIGPGSVLVVELETKEVWEEQAAAYDWVGLDRVLVRGGNWEEAVLVI